MNYEVSTYTTSTVPVPFNQDVMAPTGSLPPPWFIEKSPQAIAEEVLGPIEWVSTEEGYFRCPGHAKHSVDSGWKDCRVRIDGVPTVFCFHQSCATEINIANGDLRHAMATEQLFGEPVTTPAMSSYVPQIATDELKDAAARALPAILQGFPWSLEELQAASPSLIPGLPEQHYRRFLDLYAADDVLWIGETYESGKEEHRRNFMHVSAWKSYNKAPAPLFCPSTFHGGSFSRCNANVKVRRMLVVEADRIDAEVDAKLSLGQPLTDADKLRNKVKSAAILRWLRDAVGLRLRAVVDAANKSLHGHFDFPAPEILTELQTVLPALKCDPSVLKGSQPVRLPGWRRDGKFQKLLYLDLNPEGGHDHATA